MVRHRKTERRGVPDLSELTLEEQVVELDKRVRGGVGPMSGQWPLTDDRCGDATGEVQITHDQGRGLALLHASGHGLS
ncbi:MAG TPA: hypothetical protein VNT24_00995 [Propionibacteriaceae bacterium]|nr:hypothetical protein [Propionibacteriaceae bacterium]